MRNCSGPILFDSSSVQEILIQYNPMQGSQQYGGVGPACYNGVTDLKYLVQGDLGSRIRFDKSYLKMEYVALDISANPPVGIDLNHVSIPWNPIAACLQSVYFQLNGTNQTVERYDANFQHGNMVKMFTTYTSQALEAAHDRFFTPCIEETRDLLAGLSTTSAIRAGRWLANLGAGNAPQYGSKTIMLSDIFDSMKVETACFAQLFQLYMTIKNPDAILFASTGVVGIPRFYITGLKLFLVQDKLSESQLGVEAERITGREPMVRNSFRRFDVFTDGHASTKSYITTGIKNLQASILMFSSTTCGDLLGANPYQYTYASGPVANSGISFYRHRYGTITYPISGQTVDPINKTKNTEMYEHWRTLCRLVNDKTFSSPIPFYPSMSQIAATDTNSYVMFPAIFCNQDTAPMKTMLGAEHEIIVNGGVSTNTIGIVVRIRVCAYAIAGDTTVSIMD